MPADLQVLLHGEVLQYLATFEHLHHAAIENVDWIGPGDVMTVDRYLAGGHLT